MSDNNDSPAKDKKTLETMYWDEEMTMREIGKRFDVVGETIRRWMEEYNIPRRSHSEYAKLAYDEELRNKRREDAKEQMQDPDQIEIREEKCGPEWTEEDKERLSKQKEVTGKNNYRRRAFEEYEDVCMHCGEVEGKDNLIVHHKDGNQYNNELDNLAILCQSCHSTLHNEKRKQADYFTGKAAISTATTEILNALDVDQTHPDYKNTPNRVARSFRETCARCFEDDEAKLDSILSTTFPAEHDSFVVVDDITAFSLCPHHLKDIEYNVNFGYIPQEDGEVVGISKIPRLVKYTAKKPMTQENYTEELVNRFEEAINPKGCIAVVEGVHGCMSTRGVKCNGATTTSSLRGVVKEDAKVREEFFDLSGGITD